MQVAPHHAAEQQALRWIVQHHFLLAVAIALVQQDRHRAMQGHRKLVELTVCMLSAMDAVAGAEQVIHATYLERDIALLLQRNEQSAIVAVGMQLDAFDGHDRKGVTADCT